MNAYRDLDFHDADRDAVLVGDPYSGDWPDVPLRRNTFTNVPRPHIPARPARGFTWNPTASHTDQPGDGTPPPSSGPVPLHVRAAPGGHRALSSPRRERTST